MARSLSELAKMVRRELGGVSSERSSVNPPIAALRFDMQPDAQSQVVFHGGSSLRTDTQGHGFNGRHPSTFDKHSVSGGRRTDSYTPGQRARRCI